MKNTKGLQIGNYLYFKNTDDLAIVHLINGEKHYDCRDVFGSFIPNGNYEPIQITTKWLIDFGFYEVNENRFAHVDLDWELEKQGNKFAFCIWDYENPVVTNYIMHSQFIHEFQNKFENLTNIQLKLNESVGK